MTHPEWARWYWSQKVMAKTKEKQEASELALTEGPLHMSFPLSEPLMPKDWLPQFTRVAQITNSKASPAPPRLQILSKRENESYPSTLLSSLPLFTTSWQSVTY